MSRYVLTIDQGTTGSTVLVLSEDLHVVARGYREFPQIYPQPGWVEHDPESIWASVLSAMRQALDEARSKAGVAPSEIAAIGITNQRETTLCWDRAGRPLHNAIVWQDRRTADHCKELRDAGTEELFRKRTGLLFDPYFSGTKYAWLLKNVEGLGDKVKQGEALFGTVDSFLIYRLSGGKSHVTDPSNASRTLLFDLHQMAFAKDLAEDVLGVPLSALPKVVPSQGECARTLSVQGLVDGIPIAGIAGDQQAALFGQLCHEEGMAKCTYGTGAFLLMNTGSRAVASQNGLLTTVAWNRQGQTSYALEGSAFIAGAMVQWLRDGLGIISSAAEIEPLARSVPDSAGVVAVPALAGLGAPHWRPAARGLLWGLTRGAGRAHIARAALEGIALQNCDLLSAMEKDSGVKLASLRVDGGAAQNDLLMQLQADLLGVEIIRPQMLETTALGAGLLAGLATGLYTEEAVAKAWRIDRKFVPQMPASSVAAMKDRWAEAVSRA